MEGRELSAQFQSSLNILAGTHAHTHKHSLDVDGMHNNYVVFKFADDALCPLTCFENSKENCSFFVIDCWPFLVICAESCKPSALFKLFCASGAMRSLWPACLRSKCEIYVKQVHIHVLKMGFVCDSVISNGLLLVYAKGFKMFDEIPERDVTLKPENYTMVCVLSACSHLRIVKIEKWVMLLLKLIDEVESKNGKVDDSVNTVIVYMYGKLGRVDKSKEWFDQIGHDGKRSIIVWNAMINAYVQNGFSMEAIKLFHLMVEDCSCRPNHVTVVSELYACAQIGDLDLGRRVHEYIVYKGREGVLGLHTFLPTALIDMYSKCGRLDRAS
ncbi:Pentatricopeptide repeat [Dillenia turbinata]|uniref:Pentatricopeptide repeat n=1 Tax=Dillenia turbinata TaxID=194707 RepID=A0AAN8URX0_9MAGN